MIQNFFFLGGGGGGGVSLSPQRLNILIVGNMGVMICLGQGSLHSLSDSSWRCDKGTWTVEFKSRCRPTPVCLNQLKKTHTLCNQCLFYFVWRKCHDLIKQCFWKTKKVPLSLKISTLIEDWDIAIEILSQNQSLHLKPPPTH